MNVMFDPGELPSLLKTLTTYCIDTVYCNGGAFVNDEPYTWHRNHDAFWEYQGNAIDSSIYGKAMQLSGYIERGPDDYGWRFIP